MLKFVKIWPESSPSILNSIDNKPEIFCWILFLIWHAINNKYNKISEGSIFKWFSWIDFLHAKKSYFHTLLAFLGSKTSFVLISKLMSEKENKTHISCFTQYSQTLNDMQWIFSYSQITVTDMDLYRYSYQNSWEPDFVFITAINCMLTVSWLHSITAVDSALSMAVIQITIQLFGCNGAVLWQYLFAVCVFNA